MIEKLVSAERSAYRTYHRGRGEWLYTHHGGRTQVCAYYRACWCVSAYSCVCVASDAYNTRVRCAFVACAQDVYGTSDDNDQTDHERTTIPSNATGSIARDLSLRPCPCDSRLLHFTFFVVRIFSLSLSLYLSRTYLQPGVHLFPPRFRFRIVKIPPVTYITPPTDSTLADVANGGGGLPFSTSYLFMVGILFVYIFLMLRMDKRHRRTYGISDDSSSDIES